MPPAPIRSRSRNRSITSSSATTFRSFDAHACLLPAREGVRSLALGLRGRVHTGSAEGRRIPPMAFPDDELDPAPAGPARHGGPAGPPRHLRSPPDRARRGHPAPDPVPARDPGLPGQPQGARVRELRLRRQLGGPQLQRALAALLRASAVPARPQLSGDARGPDHQRPRRRGGEPAAGRGRRHARRARRRPQRAGEGVRAAP